MKMLLSVLCGLLLASVSVNPARGGIVHVGSAQPFTTIQAGFGAAANGDTIQIDDGLYTFASTFFVNKQVTFQATNIGGAVVSGGGFGPDDAVFFLQANSSYIGLKLMNATHGLYQRDSFVNGRVQNCIITGVTEAIGINNSGATLGNFDVFNSTIVGVSTGIGMNDGGTINVTNSIFANVGTVYVAHNNILINPDHNLLFNFTNLSGMTSSGHIANDPAQLIGDPKFVNSAGGDFHLLAGSPAIDTGKDVGLPFLGAAPDRGAFEFSASGNPSVPEPATLVLLTVGVATLTIRRVRPISK